LTALLLVFVGEISLGGADEGGKFSLVFTLNVLESDDSGSLLMHDRTETSFTLDNDVRHAHLAAEGGEEDNQLDRVYIMCDDD